MQYFGFFEGMRYGKCEERFADYENIENKLKKKEILKYLKSLPIAGVCPMSVEDIFTGEALEQAGVIDDGAFRFPIDFIHYYEKYNIGIPIEYENHILNQLQTTS